MNGRGQGQRLTPWSRRIHDRIEIVCVGDRGGVEKKKGGGGGDCYNREVEINGWVEYFSCV